MKTTSEILLRDLFDAAVGACTPANCMAGVVPSPGRGKTVVLGAGKAAASMALELERQFSDPPTGLVVTRYDHGAPCQHIEVIEASHPVPDDAGQQAAARMLAMVKDLGEDDLVICLMSGGASALLTAPAPGLSLDDKQNMNKALLKSGANITEMNCVRKHLSAIKGGRLAAAAYPARIVTLCISDVPGDDPAVIGSGPTVADPTTYEDALAVLEKYSITEPASAVQHLRRGAEQQVPETPKPGDPLLSNGELQLVARPQASLEAAALLAEERGYTPIILGDAIEGEARDVAMVHAGIAQQVIRHNQPLKAPCVILSGGETTVTVRGSGRGGRNAEFLLALALALDGNPRVHAIACDTDGIDGSEDNAGAILTPQTLKDAAQGGADAKACLANNDGYSFFEAAGALLKTGPTLTNVNDFRAIVID